MTNLTLPEGAEYPLVPFGHMPYGRGIGPRAGLLGLFPLLCFGGFTFLLLLFGFGFMARKRRAWMHHYGPGCLTRITGSITDRRPGWGTGQTALGAGSAPNGGPGPQAEPKYG